MQNIEYARWTFASFVTRTVLGCMECIRCWLVFAVSVCQAAVRAVYAACCVHRVIWCSRPQMPLASCLFLLSHCVNKIIRNVWRCSWLLLHCICDLCCVQYVLQTGLLMLQPSSRIQQAPRNISHKSIINGKISRELREFVWKTMYWLKLCAVTIFDCKNCCQIITGVMSTACVLQIKLLCSKTKHGS